MIANLSISKKMEQQRRKKMENKLQSSQPGALQVQTPNTTFNLLGNNNTLVAHTDAVNNTYSGWDTTHAEKH